MKYPGVPFGRRSPRKRGPYSTPNHSLIHAKVSKNHQSGAIPRARRCEEWCNLHGMRCEVGAQAAGSEGLRRAQAALGGRAELGWLSHWGGLLRERAGRLDVATGRLTFVACLGALTALDNPA